jgi:hypothetical protein
LKASASASDEPKPKSNATLSTFKRGWEPSCATKARSAQNSRPTYVASKNYVQIVVGEPRDDLADEASRAA